MQSGKFIIRTVEGDKVVVDGTSILRIIGTCKWFVCDAICTEHDDDEVDEEASSWRQSPLAAPPLFVLV
jgi:hypothetical protein